MVRRLSKMLLKASEKVGHCLETAGSGNLRNGQVGLFQKCAGMFESLDVQILERCHTVMLSKGSDQVAFIHMNQLGQL